MDIFLIVIAILLLIAGIAGCILPILPGPPLSYAGWLITVIVLQVLDYITPIIGSKYGGGSEFGNRGCIAGTLIGLFFMPWGIVMGPFLGAVAGELLGGSDLPHAIRAGIGSLVGFLLGTLLKVIVCFYFLVQGISAIV